MQDAQQAEPRDDDQWAGESRLVADLKWLSRLAARIIKDPGLAEDACQEAWLGAHQATGQNHGQVLHGQVLHGQVLHGKGAQNQQAPAREDLARRFRRYLHRHWRSERRRQAREQRVAEDRTEPSVEQLLIQREQQQRIWSVLTELDEPFRSTLLLRFHGDLSIQAIAQRFAIQEDTVRWRIRRGLDQVRRRLAQDEKGGGLAAIALAIPTSMRRASSALSKLTPRSQGPLAFTTTFGIAMTSKLAIGAVAALAALTVFLLSTDVRPPWQSHEQESHPSPSPSAVYEAQPPVARQAVTPSKLSPAQVLAELRSQPSQPWNEPVLHVHLASPNSSALPEEVSIQVTPFYPNSTITGTPLKLQAILDNGSADVPLGTEGSMLGYTTGIVEITADGFGRQKSDSLEIGWSEGDETELAMTLSPVASIDVIAVNRGTLTPLKEASYRVVGPSAKFGATYRSADGAAVALSLTAPEQDRDVIYLRGPNGILESWTSRELLALPPYRDGKRRLEAWNGCTLCGTVEMESGASVPQGTEIRYTTRPLRGKGRATFPHGIMLEGQVPLADDGSFEIRNLPHVTLLLHLRVKSRSIRAPQLSPDYLVDVPRADEMTFRLVVPSSPIRVTLNIRRASSESLLFVDLYRSAGERDGPYQVLDRSRNLLAKKHWVSAGEDTEMILPTGVIKEGETYILSIGPDLSRRIERRVVFHGATPRLEFTMTRADMAELPPLSQDHSPWAPEAKTRLRIAREIGAREVLHARTSTNRSGR